MLSAASDAFSEWDANSIVRRLDAEQSDLAIRPTDQVFGEDVKGQDMTRGADLVGFLLGLPLYHARRLAHLMSITSLCSLPAMPRCSRWQNRSRSRRWEKYPAALRSAAPQCHLWRGRGKRDGQARRASRSAIGPTSTD